MSYSSNQTPVKQEPHAVPDIASTARPLTVLSLCPLNKE